MLVQNSGFGLEFVIEREFRGYQEYVVIIFCDYWFEEKLEKIIRKVKKLNFEDQYLYNICLSIFFIKNLIKSYGIL